jgi:MbtH protein
VPGGWTAVEGVKGDKKTVLEYVEKTWVDMRPLSLRKWMEEQEAKGAWSAAAKTTEAVAETE